MKKYVFIGLLSIDELLEVSLKDFLDLRELLTLIEQFLCKKSLKREEGQNSGRSLCTLPFKA